MFNRGSSLLRAVGFPFGLGEGLLLDHLPQPTPEDTRPLISVIIPTRGTIFTDSIASVLMSCIANSRFFCFSFSFTTQPIPDSFNNLIDTAIRANPVFIWLVEDDIVVPDGCLESMLNMARTHNADIVIADYPLDNGRSHIKFWKGQVAYAGTGCVLMNARIFKKLEKPYFSTDWDYILRDNKFFDKVAVKSKSQRWGGQDVYFFRQAIEKGLRIAISPKECLHLRLEKMGEHLSNNGIHKISVLKFRNRKYKDHAKD